jgi:L-seryl-tRNA(Ser) seleniumtransferase
MLVLRALAAGREVIVSRGQLVEIGGSFRIPDIMAASGAKLREVGTTNITRIEDYQAVLAPPQTAMLLRVHQSNFRTRGFTSMPSIEELVALGRRFHVPVVDDIGSGALVDYCQFGLPGEPMPAASIKAGADLVLFSGDKLLGGPQAGIIGGRADLIQIIEHDPFMRAVRLDKMTLAALEATLRIYVRTELAEVEVPVLRQLRVSIDELHHRAQAIAALLPGASVREDTTYVGGGSLPDQTFPTVVVAISPAGGADALAQRLRTGKPAVVGRVQAGQVLLDLRSVFAEQDHELVAAVRSALS